MCICFEFFFPPAWLVGFLFAVVGGWFGSFAAGRTKGNLFILYLESFTSSVVTCTLMRGTGRGKEKNASLYILSQQYTLHMEESWVF